MLIGDPLGEVSNASSTNNELWRENNSFLRMRGNLDAQKRAVCSLVTLYSEGSKASSTNKESDLSQSSGGGELIPQNERELRRSEGSPHR